MASTRPFSWRTSILLKTICYLHTASWNEKWPSKRHTGYTPFALGCTPHWSKILQWYTTRATTSKSNWTAYWIETLAQQCHQVSLHTILIGVMGCAPDLESIHTGENTVAFSQPEKTMRPVHQMVLSRKLPNSVTSSHDNSSYRKTFLGIWMSPCWLVEHPPHWKQGR